MVAESALEAFMKRVQVKKHTSNMSSEKINL